MLGMSETEGRRRGRSLLYSESLHRSDSRPETGSDAGPRSRGAVDRNPVPSLLGLWSPDSWHLMLLRHIVEAISQKHAHLPQKEAQDLAEVKVGVCTSATRGPREPQKREVDIGRTGCPHGPQVNLFRTGGGGDWNVSAGSALNTQRGRGCGWPSRRKRSPRRRGTSSRVEPGP